MISAAFLFLVSVAFASAAQDAHSYTNMVPTGRDSTVNTAGAPTQSTASSQPFYYYYYPEKSSIQPGYNHGPAPYALDVPAGGLGLGTNTLVGDIVAIIVFLTLAGTIVTFFYPKVVSMRSLNDLRPDRETVNHLTDMVYRAFDKFAGIVEPNKKQ